MSDPESLMSPPSELEDSSPELLQFSDNGSSFSPLDDLDPNLDCPTYTDAEAKEVDQVSFWLEGIILCVVAIFGLLGNTFSGIILSRKSMRNSFNLLLIALAVYDNLYLVGGILESFRKRFNLVSNVHLILFPYFLYPLQMIAMTGSILMTVAIALERYVAVRHPINYSQSMSDSRALKRRLLKYLIPVLVLSLLMNVTKFLEIEINFVTQRVDAAVADTLDANATTTNATDATLDSNATMANGVDIPYEIETVPMLNITEFRMNPTYSIYFNWFRFITIGVIPFMLLVFFNMQIYMDIRARRRKKLKKTNRSGIGPNTMTLTPTVGHSEAVVIPPNANSGGGQAAVVAQQKVSTDPTKARSSLKARATAAAAAAATAATPDVPATKENGKPESNNKKGEEEPLWTNNETFSESPQGESHLKTVTTEVPEDEDARTQNGAPDQYEMRELRTLTRSCSSGTAAARLSVGTRFSMVQTAVVTANDARRRMERQMAAIMMGYVLVFLICNAPRLLLNIHELATIRMAMACSRRGLRSFPLWSLVVMHISHLMLVINSSINILIYCCLSSKFRQEGKNLLPWCKKSSRN